MLIDSYKSINGYMIDVYASDYKTQPGNSMVTVMVYEPNDNGESLFKYSYYTNSKESLNNFLEEIETWPKPKSVHDKEFKKRLEDVILSD